MALWATFFIEYWKRTQERIAFNWDMSNFEDEEEQARPNFESKVIAVVFFFFIFFILFSKDPRQREN